MALSVVLGFLFVSLWSAAEACTSLTISGQLPTDVSAYLSDASIFPLKAYYAYEPLNDRDTAVKISCYSFDSDFKVTAYDGTTGLQSYTATPTAKVISTTDALITYTIPTAYFMGANAAGAQVTLHLQGVANDVTIWEGCSATQTRSNWVLLKNSGSIDNIETTCLLNVLNNKLGLATSDWNRKGFC